MRPMPMLEIVEFPVSELVEYENNAKLHPHEQVDQIANSISEFGNNDPIAVWHDEQCRPVIVEGHGRLMALKKLGIDTAPVIFLDHLSDEQRRAYGLAHNKLTMNSDFDFEILADELGSIELDMGEFGFEIQIPENNQEFPSYVDISEKINDELGVFISCSDENEQEQVYNEIIEGGYKCRLLTL